MTESTHNEQERQSLDLLERALELEIAERSAFLDRECAGDSALRDRIEALLAAHAAADTALDRGAPLLDAATSGPPPGSDVNGFRLLEPLGEGGMGVVYRARQDTPVKRDVALKLLPAATVTSVDLLARFEAERQVLALMDHPNIARLLEAGQTQSGAPYFVMELVEGLELDHYVEQASLTHSQRLELFLTICDAVQHAHQKGIVHRDLKPANILVREIDGQPRPTIIDFGIAHLIDRSTLDADARTRAGWIVGTLEYMSPEQTDPGRDIDTRADIYSLGVLLYLLISGRLPHPREESAATSRAQLVREIRNDVPRPPSEWHPSSGGDLSTARCKELDWIVLRALAKKRSQRYASASELAADVERFLEDVPVSAAPPSLRYRAAKLLKRHRAVAIVSAGLLALLVVFGVTRQIQATRIQQALTDAEQAREQAERTAAFLGELFQSADPAQQLGAESTVGELLDRGTKRLREGLEEEPATRAALLRTIAEVYGNLGLDDVSEALAAESYAVFVDLEGERSPETLSARNDLAVYRLRLGHSEEAIATLEEVATLRREVLGSEHLDTLATEHNLASALMKHGRLAEGTELLGDLLERERRVLGDQALATNITRNGLALALHRAGDSDSAMDHLDAVVDWCQESLGSENPRCMTYRANLAVVLNGLERYAAAAEQFRMILSLQRRIVGRDHDDSLLTQQNLAATLIRLDELDEAEELLTDARARYLDLYGPSHTRTLVTAHNLARCFNAAGRFSEARAIYEEIIPLAAEALDPEHRFHQRFAEGLATSRAGLEE